MKSLYWICSWSATRYEDEMGEYQLKNFHGIRHKGKVPETDHAKVKIDVNLKFKVQKPSRKEAFNF